jgi:outer membrane receptor protein involved in Fe transport
MQTRELSPHQIHIVRLAQEVFDHVRLTLEVSNLTDTDYEDELGYPAPGRQVTAGFQYTFK